jgi:hypothetical protein
VIDWGVQAGLHVFCAVLAWSRWRFVRFATDEKAATTLGMLAECFEQLGGVPKVVLADRMGCLKGGVVANKVVPTPDYVRFASHYRFRPDWCEAEDPESKGIVENLVGYAKSDLLVPLLTDAAAGERVSVSAANTAARSWCVEVNAAVHSEIYAVPTERLEHERTLLAPMPSMVLRIGPAPVLRKVDRLSCVRFGSARYSVPMSLVGTRVQVVADQDRLRVLDPLTGELHADHVLVAPGQASVHDEHYGGARPAPRRAVRPRTVAEKAFCALGPVAEAFITGASAAGHTRLGPELVELSGLEAAHGRDALIAALDRAVAFKRWRAADVASILTAGTGLPEPRAGGELLAVDLPAVPVRALSAYSLATINQAAS